MLIVFWCFINVNQICYYDLLLILKVPYKKFLYHFRQYFSCIQETDKFSATSCVVLEDFHIAEKSISNIRRQRTDSNDDRRGCKKSVQYWVSSIFTHGQTYQEQNYDLDIVTYTSRLSLK